MEVLEGMSIHVDEYIDVDENSLVVAITFAARARHTGIQVEMHPFHVFSWRDGKVVRWQVLLDRCGPRGFS